ncbi:MAG: SGNH/GDSL hydrolase family protein [Opitutales bacterium]|nr:SGNH/GDSL hydrolase family protein [Opitutales bacterium]
MTSHRKLRVTFFGDSICTGQHVAIHQGWVTRTSLGLSKIMYSSQGEIVVTNSSVNGRTTRQALETMAYELQSHSPEIVIIQFGMNDCNYWASDRGLPRVSRPSFSANLSEIIQRSFHYGAKRVFLNTNHPTTLTSHTFPHTETTYQSSNADYNKAIRNVAESSGATLNDVENHFLALIDQNEVKLSDMLLPEDQLHLSSIGHDAYYSFIYPKIEESIICLLDD